MAGDDFQSAKNHGVAGILSCVACGKGGVVVSIWRDCRVKGETKGYLSISQKQRDVHDRSGWIGDLVRRHARRSG